MTDAYDVIESNDAYDVIESDEFYTQSSCALFRCVET